MPEAGFDEPGVLFVVWVCATITHAMTVADHKQRATESPAIKLLLQGNS